MATHDADLPLPLPTVEQRLNALERENRDLRARLDAQHPVERRPSVLPDAAPATEQLSRRWLLRLGMQAAAATVAAGVLLRRETDDVSAHHLNPGITVNFVGTHLLEARTLSNTDAAVLGENGSGFTGGVGAPGVKGINNDNGIGVLGEAEGPTGVGVSGTGGNQGVYGFSETGDGVRGDGPIGVRGTSGATDQAGVRGIHVGTGGYGVVGDGVGASQAGVLGRNSGGQGVRGEGVVGVRGTSPTTNQAGVHGVHTGTGYGVVGDGVGGNQAGVLGRNAGGQGVRGEGTVGVWGTSPATDQAGVRGIHTGFGYGVVGDGGGTNRAGVLGRNSSGDGVSGIGKIGVRGTSAATGGNALLGQATGAATGVTATSVAGYGGSFKGGKAQVRLVPAASAGAPTDGAHTKGELFLDATAALFICTASGSPGTWRKVSTVAV